MDTTTKAPTRQIKVPFHGAELYVVEYNGEPYTPMKPIVDGMGLNWKSQHVKVKQRFASTMVEITMVAEDGKSRLMSCLAVRKLPGWLHSLNIGKIRPELRDRVAQYQAECDDALWRYWNTGIAVNPAQARTGSARSTLTDRADALRSATELVIDRHVPYSAAYKVLQLYAGTLSFRAMTCDQANNAADFGRRLLSHLDTPNDWKQIAQNREDIVGGHVQLPLTGLVHSRLGPTDD
ncbi:phage antirepressor N-terminal domain-containing protein [Caballeronia sp. dw_19]|uniref:phage antirepressor N-terminal domain-containing protein n=1 Tax=Caballeronia sp. dw_19 TaxID=2719791 RepID=UPI001BCD1589